MAKVKVHAGDFEGKHVELSLGTFLVSKDKGWGADKIESDQIESVDIATEENVKKIGGTLGWGAAGAVLLGPAGLLAGLLLGGRKKEVTFIAKFKDGRRMLATTTSKAFTKLQAAIF